MISRRRWLGSVLVLGAGIRTGLCAAEDAIAPVPSDFVEITPKQEECIEKALAWLAKNQSKDGSWGSEGASGSYQMAMTGLAGLALLSAGHSPGRGKYGQNVARAIEFCLKNQDRDGLISSRNDGQQMYGHGFSMTFLGEAYGMDSGTEFNERIKHALTIAVKKTQQSQSSRGGWYYSPNSGADEGSVTVTQVQAMRSARNAGIDVPEKVMNSAIDYVKQCQNSDGGIRYSVQSGQTSSVALTAAGAEVFMMAGRYKAQEAARACEYLKKNLDPRRAAGHDFYTHFYGAQAMFQIGGEYWARYFTSIRDRLISQQRGDGSWNGDDIGSTYGTAIATLILSMPYRYLPIFQK
ncbi:MAG TPA: prenyltransferase/squalene oxidase repeat-containing protein [Planctomycetota bacterium]|nr:prenyltransferase/squalene oxidase repeat-containing protein [Planctomycetota bacterium]